MNYGKFTEIYQCIVEEAKSVIENNQQPAKSIDVVANLYGGKSYVINKIDTVDDAMKMLLDMTSVTRSAQAFLKGTASINKDFHVMFTLDEVQSLGYCVTSHH